MKLTKGRFEPLVFIKWLILIVLMSAPSPRSALAGDFPTLNELMEKGELEDMVSDEAPPSQTPEAQPSEAPPTPAVASHAPVSLSPLQLSEKVVMIGRVPYVSTKGIMVLVKGLTAFLRKELGVRAVRVVTAKDYAGVLKALEHGTIDFAWLGPAAYVIGNDKTPLVPIAQAKRRTGATYHGLFITRKDSRILGIDDIKGKVIGFVDPESASGYLYPLYFLKRFKINPHKDCKKVEFLQKHDAVLAAVLSRKIDVGVCLEDTIESLKDQKILDQILILGKTDEVPSDIVACREDCPPTLRDKLKNALMKTGTLKQTASSSTGLPPIMEFLPVNDDDLNNVKNVLKDIKDIRQQN
ncbi:MAG: phosphate/phosphite/phosphonate ABC transporter substrate-binding protein [Candidatus Riflebacteria bacterium]|nr:phosphate/phosphite/phosphonate ABC transporter substrate-binding protein [Candidatus Riflebacteria bacterium]